MFLQRNKNPVMANNAAIKTMEVKRMRNSNHKTCSFCW